MPALLATAPSRVITVSSGGITPSASTPPPCSYPPRITGRHGVRVGQEGTGGAEPGMARRLAGTGVAFHAMHPGWVDTPRVAAALPGFHRITRPILLSPEQGADTIVWLALRLTRGWAAAGSGTTGARPEHPLPWTRDKDPGAARELWDHLAAATATDSPKLAQAGWDSVAVEHDIPARGQR